MLKEAWNDPKNLGTAAWYVVTALVVLVYARDFMEILPDKLGPLIGVLIELVVLVFIVVLLRLVFVAMRAVDFSFQVDGSPPADYESPPSGRPEAFPSPATLVIGIWLLFFTITCVVGVFLSVYPPQWPDSWSHLFPVNNDVRLAVNEALIMLFAAGIGSCITAIMGYLRHASVEKDFDLAYAPWYVARPVMGMLLGLIFYFLIKGGVLVTVQPPNGQDIKDLNDWGLAGIGALVGLFSKNAIEKLKEVFQALFHTEREMRKRVEDEMGGGSSPP